MNDIKQPTAFLFFAGFLALFFVAVFSLSVRMFTPDPALEDSLKTKTPAVAVALHPLSPDPFNALSLEAEAAYVLDVRTGKALFAKNEESQLPLASLAKVMTALVSSDLSGGADTAVFDGEKWRVKELLDYTLMVSSNNGASALAAAGAAILSENTKNVDGVRNTDLFIQKMNEEARTLHLTQTFYLNPNGLDVGETLSGAYGSAKDMALLFEHILKNKPTLLEATAYDSLRFSSLGGVSRMAENTNIIARATPGLLASKTGFTDLAGGNLVIAFDIGPARPVIAAVLGSSQSGRFSDMEKIVAASIEKVGQEGSGM